MHRPALLPLTLAVLAAHMGLLGLAPWASTAPRTEAPPPPSVTAFATRSIASPPSRRAEPAPPPTPITPHGSARKPPPPVANDTASAAPPEEPLAAPVADTAPEAIDEPVADLSALTDGTLSPPEASVELPAPLEPETQAPLAATQQGVQLALPGEPARVLDAGLPAHLPRPARLSFEVKGRAKGFDYQADAQLGWQHDGARYQLRQELKVFLLGRRAQASTGRIDTGGLVPERFEDLGRRTRTADLDTAAGRVRFLPSDNSAPIGAGAQDRLSVFLQLSSLLHAAPAQYPVGSEITFTIVGGNSAERWTFRVQPEDTLELPYGTLAALRLERQPRHPTDQQATVWLAPALDYLPARILLIQENGDLADLRLRSVDSP